MFVTVFRRLTGNKWKALSLLVGLVLAVAIAFSIPVYTNGILQRMLSNELENIYLKTGRYPSYISAVYKLTGNAKDSIGYQRAMQSGIDDTIKKMGLNASLSGLFIEYRQFQLKSEQSNSSNLNFIFNYIADFENYVNIKVGRMYNPDRDDGVIEVVVRQKFLIDHNLTLNRVYELSNIFSDEGPISFEIVGVVEAKDANELFWFKEFEDFEGMAFCANQYFEQRIMNEPSFSRHVGRIGAFSVIDFEDIKVHNVPMIVKAYENGKAQLANYPGVALGFEAADTLSSFVKASDTVFASMLIVIIPIFVLLVFFIIMVSWLKVESEQNEISVMQSRGASRLQILKLYFLESVMLSLAALVLGVPLGLFFCRVIGASNGFLQFVDRAPLEINIRPIAVYVTLATAVFFMLVVMIPAFAGAGVNIVESKRKKTLRHTPFYHRFFLDFLLLGAGIYGYLAVKKKLDYYTETRTNFTITTGDSDFLMYISVVLFALGAGMLFLRIYPVIVQLIFKLGKKIWPSWMYFSLNRTGQNRDCSSIMLFLILTVSIGIFNADSARSINYHAETNTKVLVGADAVYTPKWKLYNANTGEFIQGSVEPGQVTLAIYDEGIKIQEIPIMFKEMYPESFYRFDEIENIARVYTDEEASVRYISGERTNSRLITDVNLMCTDPYDFAMTAYSSSYMNYYHINEYANALIQVDNGAVLSNALMEKLGAVQGDRIRISCNGGQFECTVIGGVDNWPGIESYYENTDGVLKQKYFVIAKLSTMFAENRIVPYSFWIKKAEGVTDRELYDALKASDYGLTQFESATTALIEAKNQPVLQGTNGLLSVSFITSVVICALGFLTYWIISIKNRTLQFGISRALGVTKVGIMLMLISEQVLISGMAFGVGIVIGKIGSTMFVPLLGLNYITPTDVVPFIVMALRSDFYRILITMCGMLLICFSILSGMVIRQKIDRAIKLGED